MKDCKRSGFLPIGLASHSPHYLAAAPQPCQESMGCVWLCILDPLQLRDLDGFTSVERASCPACIHTDPVAHTANNSKKQTHKSYTSTLIRLSAPIAAPLESTLGLRASIYSLSQQSKVAVE